LKDAALHGRSVASTKTINDNQTSRGRYIEISQLKRLTKRLENKDSDLGFKGSSEDESPRACVPTIFSRVPGTLTAIWYAIVVMKDLVLLRVGSEREKKLASRSFHKLQRCAISCAMADFPDPADPYNYNQRITAL
jgi:hypothetical protein